MMFGDTQCDQTKITYVLIRSHSLLYNVARMVFFVCVAEFEVDILLWIFLFSFFTAPRINLIGFVCVVTTMIPNTIQTTNQPSVWLWLLPPLFFWFRRHNGNGHLTLAMTLLGRAVQAATARKKFVTNRNYSIGLCSECWFTVWASCRSAPLRHFMIKLKLSFALHSILNRFQLKFAIQVLLELDINEVVRVYFAKSNRSFGVGSIFPFLNMKGAQRVRQSGRGLYQNDDAGISCITLMWIRRSIRRHRVGWYTLCHWCGIFVYWHAVWCVYIFR